MGAATMPASCAASATAAPPVHPVATPRAEQRRQSKAAAHCEVAAGVAGAAAATPGQAAAKAAEEAAAAAGQPSSWLTDGDASVEECKEDNDKNELRKRRTSGHKTLLRPVNLGEQQEVQMQQEAAPQQGDEERAEKLQTRPEKPRICSHSSDAGPVAAGTIVIRPFLRGKIHLLLFFLSPLWIFLLLSACSSTRSIVAAAISCLSFAFNFFASALLHCFEWADRPALQQLLHKLDHAGIFFVISGSTSPIPVLLLDASSSFWLLLVQFAATCYGFVSIIFGDLSSAARKRRAYTYIIVGLLHALFLSEYYRVLTHTELLAVFTLSTLYVLGALVYGFKWPDPFPAVYGFHEVFHSFCLLSFLVTVWLDYVVIRRAEWTLPVPAAAKEEVAGHSISGESPGVGGKA